MSAFERKVKAKLEKFTRTGRHARPNRRACCKDVSNLQYAPGLNQKLDVVVLRCKHCHAIHREAAAKPGRLGFGSQKRVR